MSGVKKLYPIYLWLFFIILIIGMSVYLIIIANGYKINYKTWGLSKTGMIYLKSNPANVQIYIDGTKKSNQSPYRLSEILPGKYDVKIKLTDYHDWVKTFDVKEGMISSDENIILILEKPKDTPISDMEIKDFNLEVSSWSKKDLRIVNQNELWLNDKLITRYFEPIRNVVWYSDNKHIILQVGNEIKIIDPDGSNIVKLVRLASDNVSQFMPKDDKFLLYKDGDKIKKIEIR